MRRNLTALLLTFGVVAGFGSGIVSCSRGGHGRWANKEGCDREGKAAAAVAKEATTTTPAATTTTTPPAAAPIAEPAPAPVEPAPEG